MNPHRKNPFLPWAIVLMGFTSIVAQVLLMRELVVIFYGNELSLGTILGVWLFLTAIGSSFLAKILKKSRRTHLRIGFIQLILSQLFPLVLLLVRSSKTILGIILGEMIGFVPMLLITLVSLAPFCLLSGLLYTTACQYVHQWEEKASTSIGKVYLLEAVGSGVGGLLASFIFVRFITPARITLLLSTINLISAILVGNLNPFRSKTLRTAWILLVPLIFGFFGLRFSEKFQSLCNQLLWKGYDLVTTQNTVFGNLTVTRMANQTSFFENGLLMFTTPDRLTAEESVHFTLLEHIHPRKVLLIGGGLGGGILETLRHPTIEKVDYVELDPTIVQLAEKILPPEQIQYLKDPRVSTHHIDGRLFVKKTSNQYDVILLNLPNPYTAQLNRFYTIEFFREINKKLSPGGVFSLQVISSENAIGPELSNFLSTLNATLTSVFPDIVIIPGETNLFVTSNQFGVLTSDPNILVQRLNSRNLQTLYVREYYFPYQMSEERQAYLTSKIQPLTSDRINRDFKPIGYFYDTILWATTFSTLFKKIFVSFATLTTYHIAGLFALITLFLILLQWRPKQRTRLFPTGIRFSVLSIGFTEISLEVILILGFQILYGYVYQQLAVLVTGYMVGLAIGTRLAILKKISEDRVFPHFRLFQLIMFLYPLFLSGLLWILHHLRFSILHSPWIIWIFPLLTTVSGFIGGYQFPLANRLYLRTGKSIEKVAGFLYAFDLTGSSVGALLTSVFFIPILGIFSTLILLGVLNLCSLIILMLSKE